MGVLPFCCILLHLAKPYLSGILFCTSHAPIHYGAFRAVKCQDGWIGPTVGPRFKGFPKDVTGGAMADAGTKVDLSAAVTNQLSSVCTTHRIRILLFDYPSPKMSSQKREKSGSGFSAKALISAAMSSRLSKYFSMTARRFQSRGFTYSIIFG